MSEYKIKVEKLSLPLVALSETVAFPGEIVNLEISDNGYGSCEAIKEAFEGSKYAVAIPLLPGDTSELYEVGTVIKIKQILNAGEFVAVRLGIRLRALDRDSRRGGGVVIHVVLL